MELGSQVTFTMVVRNNGVGTATGVMISDSLPAGLELVSTSASQGSCSGTSCSIGTVADGGSATMTLRARAKSVGTRVNTASVSASTSDPVPANGTDSATVVVSAPASPPAALPAPESGEVNIAAAAGSGQCVALKGEPGCQPLTGGEQIDISDISYIDPGKGKVEIQSIVGTGNFYGGRFDLTELAGSSSRSAAMASAKPVLLVGLVGGSFRSCPKGQRSLSSSTAAQAKKPVRRLWGKGKGRFRTKGRYSSGTVRGTNWLTTDYCDGTETRVVAGVVQVRDFVKKKTVMVKPGQKYFAQAGKIN